MQRLETMFVTPDVLPSINPVVDVQLRFQRKNFGPGDMVHSLLSEKPPTIKVVPFERGEMLCTIAVVDPGTLIQVYRSEKPFKLTKQKMFLT